jgi:hypothetical protein
MLTIEIRVNGNIVTVISAINVLGEERCHYRYTSASFPMTHGQPCITHGGTVMHERGEGIERLADKLCAAAADHEQELSR